MWNLRLVLVCLVASGCSTIKTELYSTDGCSDVKTTKHLKGMPITVDVPTHLKVEITEKRFFRLATVTKKPGGEAGIIGDDKKAVQTKSIEPRPDLPPMRDVKITEHVIPELYTVDLKRPFSGNITYKMDFKGQYFTALNTKTEDTTITDVAALAQTIISTLPTFAGMKGIKLAGGPDPTPDLIEMETVVAFEMFSVRDPQIYAKIQAFVEAYMNGCTPPCLPDHATTVPAPHLSRRE